MTDKEESEPRFKLYYHPVSYYSHKVQMALYEKDEPFTGQIVQGRLGEGIDRWFMLINPKGKVPVLEDRGRIITESEDIIDYLDKHLTREPQLVPPVDTELGKKVDRIRKLLIDELPITHGVWYHPDLSPRDPNSPWNKAEWEDSFEKTLARLARLAEENEDLKEIYIQKLASFKARVEVVRDRSRVQAAIDSLHPIFDQVEQELSGKDESESWLCGPSFTAADISLTELINRLNRTGLDTVFVSPSNRPAVYHYWQRAQKRPSFIKMKEHEKLYMTNSKN